jgi:hypothetical protein
MFTPVILVNQYPLLWDYDSGLVSRMTTEIVT